MKEQLLSEINIVLYKIELLSPDDSIFSLDNLVYELIDYLGQLSNEPIDSNDKNLCELAIRNLHSTLDREIFFAKSAYKKAKQKNAASIRMIEYSNFLNNAIRKIKIDIPSFIEFNRK